MERELRPLATGVCTDNRARGRRPRFPRPAGTGTSRAVNVRTSLSSDWVVRLAALCLTWFVAVVAAEHAVRGDLSPDHHRISEYAVGSAGWLMTTGFLAWTAAFALTAVVLQRTPLRPAWVARVIAGLMVLCAVGALGTALFKTGTSAGIVPAGRDLTASNHAHDISSGALEWSLFAAVVCSLAVDGTHRLRTTTILLLVAALAASFLFSGAVLDLPGARQRALLGVACVWHFLLLRAVGAGALGRVL